MHTVDEILAAAATLDRSELAKLRSEIQQMEKAASAILLNGTNGVSFRLTRLSDDEHAELWRRSLPIEEDFGFYRDLHLDLHRGNEESLNLAQAYLALKFLSGDSSKNLDEDKMAFSFPFLMHVFKDKQPLSYLLDVRSIRGSLYFSLYKVVDPHDPRLKERHVLEPLEEELGRETTRYFMSHFYGYLMGVWDALKRRAQEPFVRKIPRSCIILGYCGGQAFEQQFDTTEDFEAAWHRYSVQVDVELRQHAPADVPWIARRVP
jgi:hypothetical protein